MSSPTLAALLLASALQPGVAPSLELRVLPANQLELKLCFQGAAQAVRFDLRVESSGQAGHGSSRQQGGLRLDGETLCPVRIRLGDAAEREVRVRLEWSVDGIAQPPVVKSLRQT
ncbi:hypothetical protein D9M68_150190 [compost metagenome]